MSNCQCFCHTNVKAVGFYGHCICDCKSLSEKLNSLNELYKELWVKVQEIMDWKKKVKILCDQSRKPNKCPSCDGHGEYIVCYPNKGYRDCKCKSCDGKGYIIC